MNDTVYYISEASKKVEVEPHVLRYWEDELKLPIERNEMGHRCYKEKDIETLRRIKLLKEQGLQLRAIRVVLQGGGHDLYSPQGAEDAPAGGTGTKALDGGTETAADGSAGTKAAGGAETKAAAGGGTKMK
ncbi:MAG: MerR family transcriptional regulator [Lachnospiraceae bacterium]|nr:MerR family transcriptional regulator [Lachnospiraceae bacterium]